MELQMGYPVSYRHGARGYGGGSFQEPAPNRQPLRDPMHPPYKDPPRPANDPFKLPANDNEPRGRYSHPRFPKLPPFPGMSPPGASGSFPRPPRGRFRLPRIDPLSGIQIVADLAWPSIIPRIGISPGTKFTCGPVAMLGPQDGYIRVLFAGAYPGGSTYCGLGGQVIPGGKELVGIEGEFVNTNGGNSGLYTYVGQYNLNRSRCRWIAWMSRRSGDPRTKIVVSRPSLHANPSEVPAPMPYTVANPLPAFVPQPMGNEVPALKPMPAAIPRGPEAYAPVVTARKPEGKIDPSVPGVVIVPDAPLPPRQPPGRGVKERKVTEQVPGLISGALGAAAGVYENAKFANDLINAFYDALPGKHSANTPQDKLAELYRRYNEVDIDKAIAGVLKAVAYEKAGSYIDRARRTASNNLGLHMHIQIPTGGGPRV